MHHIKRESHNENAREYARKRRRGNRQPVIDSSYFFAKKHANANSPNAAYAATMGQ